MCLCCTYARRPHTETTTLYGQLVDGQRRQDGQKKRFKDSLRVTLKSCGIRKNHWEEVADDRTVWRASASNYEQRRVEEG